MQHKCLVQPFHHASPYVYPLPCNAPGETPIFTLEKLQKCQMCYNSLKKNYKIKKAIT